MGETKTALVTGASSGIGLELAREFVEHGYDLVVAAEDTAIHDVPNRLVEYGGGTGDPGRSALARRGAASL